MLCFIGFYIKNLGVFLNTFSVVSNRNLVLLKSAGFYIKDPQSGKEGITLVGILIFGKDELIFAALPHFKTDTILRIENLDRYDDRDDIRTNLIDSYERLVQFIAKHLNDKFYLEKQDKGTGTLSCLNIDGQGVDAELTVNWSDLGSERLYNGISVTMINTGNTTSNYRVHCQIGSSGWGIPYDDVESGEIVNVVFISPYMGANLAFNPQATYDVVVTVADRESYAILDTITGTLTILNP